MTSGRGPDARNTAGTGSFGLRQEVVLEAQDGSNLDSASFSPHPPPPDLSGLLEAAAKGDERAWRAVVDLYARRVYALARSRLGGGGGGRGGRTRGSDFASGPWGQGSDVAEEVTQSVFVTVAGKLSSGEYAEQGKFESWLFRVAMNRVRDEVRRLRRHAVPTDPESFGTIADGRDHAAERTASEESEESIRGLRSAMAQLGETDREIVELRHHAGLSFKQIADLLDEPIGTLLARHHRALRKLKDLITSERPTPELAGPGLTGPELTGDDR